MRLQLETDCQVLVNLWENRSSQKSEIAPLLRQMEEMSQSFEFFSLRFVSRDCNKLAHECARLVSTNSQVKEWHVAPPRLRDIINIDCNPDLD